MIDLNKNAHSNDKVELETYDGIMCVKKTMVNDLKRAQKSLEKQKSFKPLNSAIGSITAAEIINLNECSSKIEILMPYVEGVSGDAFAVYANQQSASALSLMFSNLIYHQLEQSFEAEIKLSLFLEKIKEVKIKTDDADLKEIIELVEKRINNFPDVMSFPIGPCHGDLTLTNVILGSRSDLTLIDFLHTFFESPLQDVAKLKQDYIYGWSCRHRSSAIQIKARIISDNFLPKAIKTVEKIYPIQVELINLLGLCRIAPYIKDQTTKDWLIKSIKKTI